MAVHYEDLPAELLRMIMGRTSSPADLRSLTSASPRSLRALAEGCQAIIKSVVLRAIPAANLPLALAACDAPIIRGSLLVDFDAEPIFPNNDDEIIQKLTDMMPRPRPTGDAVWQRLYRLSGLIDIYIMEFSQHAVAQLRSALGKLSAPQTPSSAEPPLSNSERERLQRAFLRFELLRKCWMAGKIVKQWSSRGLQQLFIQVFLGVMQLWEREELSSIYAFLRWRLERTFDEVEEFTMTALHRGAVEEGRRATKKQCPIDRSKSYLNLLNDLDTPCLWFFERSFKYTQDDQVDAIMALGLPFLRKLWTVTPATRVTVVKSYAMVMTFDEFQNLFGSRFMGDLADCSDSFADPDSSGLEDKNPTPSTEVRPSEVNATITTAGKPNAGWLWALSCGQPSNIYRDHGMSGWNFARLGLPFWDESRLEAAGLYHTTYDRLDKITEDEGPGRHRQPSVQERLEGVWVTPEIMEEVEPALFDHFDEEDFLQMAEY